MDAAEKSQKKLHGTYIVVPLIKRIVVIHNLVNAFLLARRQEFHVRVHHNQCDMPWLSCELSNRAWISSIGSTFGSSTTWGIWCIKSRFFPTIITIFSGKISWVTFCGFLERVGRRRKFKTMSGLRKVRGM